MDEQPTSAEPVRSMSFSEKLTNIFASPGELFENVRMTDKATSNWLVPWLVFVVVAIVMGQLIVHNASLADQLGATIKKGFDKQVQEGKMPAERADQIYEQYAKPGSTMFTISQVGGTVIVSLAALFALALLYWLIGKTAMKATSSYMKVVEVIGLVFFIAALEQIVTTLMMIAMDSIHATPSLGIFVSNFDMENKAHLALAKINVFTFWNLSVVGVGLSKLFQRDFPKVLVLVFAVWILWSLITIFSGIKLGG